MKTALPLLGWLFTLNMLSSDAPQPRTELARLIVYRQKEFGGNSYVILVNDKRIGALTPNRYFNLNLPPGRTKIESGKTIYAEAQTVWLTLQPGRTYYVKAVEEIDFLTRTLLMAPVSSAQAEQELRRVKPEIQAATEPNE